VSDSSSLISVVVPCYNHGHYLAESLDSVLNQSYNNWECIIVNDGSSDHTEEVSSGFCKKDNRFHLINIENGGLANARNVGIKKSLGKYILPLDADDKIGPDYLTEATKILDQDQEVSVVYSKAEYFGEKAGSWELPPYSLFELMFNNMIFCTALFRRYDFETYGGYKPDMKYGFEDWDLWLGILKKGGKVVRLDHTHFYYRITKNSMVNSMTQEQYEVMQKQIWERHADVWVTCYDELVKMKSKLDEVEKKPIGFFSKKLMAKIKKR